MRPVIKPAPSKTRGGLLQITWLLAAVVALLFWRSFLPGYVHFSNDGPLAMQVADCMSLPAGFNGQWFDLCWIGSNAASCPFGIASFIKLFLGPVGYAKFLPPIAIVIIGLCAWFLFKRLKFSPLACGLGAFAAALNSAFLGTACWGVAGQIIGFGMDYLALALVVSNSNSTPRWLRWLRLILAGLAVGMGVIEGADNGAIFSMFVAAFVFYKSLIEEGTLVKNIARGVGRVTIIALFAGLLATQSIVGLVGTAIQGVAGTKQDAGTKAAQWDFATQWSFPKIETLSLVMPGLFGYRMDTPKDMPEFLKESHKGGNYWGAAGRDPVWDRFFANGSQGPAPDPNVHYIRFSGGGGYAGVFVVLVALWAMAQSFRRKDSVFSPTQRRLIWFWSAAMLISLLLAYGRFAPFYQFLYKLPYFSTIRNPCKFVSVFSWALVIVFGYGIHGLSRRYLETASASVHSPFNTFKSWWAKAAGFDRKWILGCLAAIAISLIGWLVYWNYQPQLTAYLQTVGFPEDYARLIASFSVRQVFWFILFLMLGTGALAFAFSGAFSGKRAKMGGFLMGCVLVADLGRADLPYIVHWNYKQKYEVGTLNPIISFLAQKPYEQRVMRLPFDVPPEMGLFGDLYRIEWSQQFFPYYNILQLDIIQMARRTEDFLAFEDAMGVRNNQMLYLIPRRWELTSTRYLLGAMVTRLTGMDTNGQLVTQNFRTLDFLDNRLDAGRGRFRVLKQFEIALKPGIANFTKDEDLTVVEDPKGRYALFEFTGALPHASLYSHWQVSTNDEETLKAISSVEFPPHQTVLVATPLPVAPGMTNQNPGEVKFASYKPAHIVFTARAETNAVLLLNDHYDPMWHVLVDGKPAELLRCNYIMRGVFLTPGTHTVDFRFQPPLGPGYVTLAVMGLGILLSALLIYSERRVVAREQSPEMAGEKSPQPAKRR